MRAQLPVVTNLRFLETVLPQNRSYDHLLNDRPCFLSLMQQLHQIDEKNLLRKGLAHRFEKLLNGVVFDHAWRSLDEARSVCCFHAIERMKHDISCDEIFFVIAFPREFDALTQAFLPLNCLRGKKAMNLFFKDDFSSLLKRRTELNNLNKPVDFQALSEKLAEEKVVRIMLEMFMVHLQIIKDKTDELERNAQYDSNYLLAFEAATVLIDRLEQASEEFIQSGYTPEHLEQFKTSCQTAILDAHEILDEHRGWKNILMHLLLFIMTLGIGSLILMGYTAYQTCGKHLFFKVETDSSRILSDAQQVLQTL